MTEEICCANERFFIKDDTKITSRIIKSNWSQESETCGLGLELDLNLRPVDLDLDLQPMDLDLDLTISESEDLDLDLDLDLPPWDLTTSRLPTVHGVQGHAN